METRAKAAARRAAAPAAGGKGPRAQRVGGPRAVQFAAAAAPAPEEEEEEKEEEAEEEAAAEEAAEEGPAPAQPGEGNHHWAHPEWPSDGPGTAGHVAGEFDFKREVLIVCARAVDHSFRAGGRWIGLGWVGLVGRGGKTESPASEACCLAFRSDDDASISPHVSNNRWQRRGGHARPPAWPVL